MLALKCNLQPLHFGPKKEERNQVEGSLSASCCCYAIPIVHEIYKWHNFLYLEWFYASVIVIMMHTGMPTREMNKLWWKQKNGGTGDMFVELQLKVESSFHTCHCPVWYLVVKWSGWMSLSVALRYCVAFLVPLRGRDGFPSIMYCLNGFGRTTT